MRQSRPDVVNVLLGTNDINIGKRNAATIVGAYTSLLSSMRAVNPNIIVVVSSSDSSETVLYYDCLFDKIERQNQKR